MYYSVDRIEGDKAVLEDDDGKRTVVSTSLLPSGTDECDVLLLNENGEYKKDDEEKLRRQKLIQEMLENM